MDVVGLLLAAGAGRRMGRPKALVADWLPRSVDALVAGGCARVTVVLGAAVDEAVPLLAGHDVDIVVAEDWDTGMGASLRAGLRSLDPAHDAAMVTLVDLPDVGPAVVSRVLAAACPDPAAALARASYGGRAGHPVLLGRDHWAGVAAAAGGDRGARDYLSVREVREVECGDLATGRDVDR